MKNKREMIVRDEARKLNWRILDKGWPDYLFYNEHTGKIVFVEVKSYKDKLSKSQKLMHKLLKQLNLEVMVIRVSKKSFNNVKNREKIRELMPRPGI